VARRDERAALEPRQSTADDVLRRPPPFARVLPDRLRLDLAPVAACAVALGRDGHPPADDRSRGLGAWGALAGADLALAVLFQLAVYGPAVAALAVLLRSGDRGGARGWARSLVRLRVPWRWYAFVALAPVALAVAVVALGAATGGGVPVWAAVPALSTVFLLFVTQTLTSGLEEPGWRGFALPLMQRSMTAERANWLLGLVWAAWHLPFLLYLYRDMPVWTLPLTLAGFTMSIVAMGYVHAWVYNSTGSVALNVLLHGWANVTNAVAVSVMASPLVPLATAGVTWLFVAWLLRRYGGARRLLR
jgi:uncharacterized protein